MESGQLLVNFIHSVTQQLSQLHKPEQMHRGGVVNVIIHSGYDSNFQYIVAGIPVYKENSGWRMVILMKRQSCTDLFIVHLSILIS